MTWLVGTPHPKHWRFKVLWPEILLPRDHVRKRPHDSINEGSSSLVTTKKVGNRSCESGNVTFLLCHEISSENLVNGHMTLWVEVHYSKSPLC